MSKKARIYVEGYELDLADDTNVPLNLQVTDIKDVNKRVGDFTKTISVPATKNNNKILGNAFNLNIEFQDNSQPNVQQNFNPKKKAQCILESNNITFSEGYIQLQNIRKKEDMVWYDIVFYGRLSDIVSAISGNELTDLDFTDLNHTISLAHVTGSWTSGGDYIYPFVDYGHANIRSHGEVNIGNLKPVVKLKRYIDQIFEESNFTYDAPFFQTTEFNNLYVVYNGVDDNTLSKDERDELTSVGSNTQVAGIDERYPVSGNDFATRTINQYETDDDVLGTGHLTGGPPVLHLYQYEAPETRLYNIQLNGLISLEAQYTGNNSPETSDFEDEWMLREHEFNMYIQIYDSNNNEVTGLRQRESFLRQITDLTADDEIVDSRTIMPTPGSNHFDLARTAQSSPARITRFNTERYKPKQYEWTIQFNKILLQAGDRVKVNYSWYSQWEDDGCAWFGDCGSGNTTARVNVGGSNRWASNGDDSAAAWVRIENDSFIEVEPLRHQVVDTTITQDEFIPIEVQQKDLLLSTLKLFNLVAIPDSENPRNLLIRERDDFFESGDVIDVTNRVVMDMEQKSQPVRDADVRRWVYKWNDGKDFYTKLYNNLTDRHYGDVKVDNNSEFGKDDRVNIDIIFEPTTMVEYEQLRTFGIVVTFPYPAFKDTVVVENTDDIEQITGVGQSITIVVSGTSYRRTITAVDGNRIQLDTPVSDAKGDQQYGVVIENNYDRISIPSYKGKEENIGQDPVETNPKLVYYSGLKSCNAYNLTDVIDSVELNQYPVIGHLNAHPDDNPTFDYNFGRPSRVFFDIGTYPTDNLYTEYHSQTLQEILNGSTILNLYIYLTQTELINLKYNTKFWIDGVEYRVNKIKDFDLNHQRPTQIELIRI